MDKLKLKWKIFMLLLGFCALLLTILWLFQTVLLDTFYKNIRVSEIKRDAQTIVEYLADDASSDDSLAQTLAALSQDGDYVANVVNADGSSVTAASIQQDNRAAEENRRQISHARAEGGEFYEYHTPDSTQSGPGFRPPGRPTMQSLVYVSLAQNAAGEERAVIIRAVISPVNATVDTLRYQLYIISGIMLFASIGLAIIIAKRVSRPIEDISVSAAVLARGDYSVRFSGKGFAEIVALSNTLNITAKELGKVEGLRRELLANVSHDLRTPLALIYSYAEMMRDFPDEIAPEQPATIMDEARRLSGLVNDVLDISKLESGMEQFNPASFNLTSCVAGSVRRMNELLTGEGFSVTFDYNAEIIVVADEAKIDRAFYNLLINAVNYAGADKTVSVKQTVTGNNVRVSVTDNGDGIPPDDLPVIWDRYYKSAKAHRRGVAGTGLGLSIVKKIIELHGGNYGVDSQPGQGSTFWFEIILRAGQ